MKTTQVYTAIINTDPLWNQYSPVFRGFGEGFLLVIRDWWGEGMEKNDTWKTTPVKTKMSPENQWLEDVSSPFVHHSAVRGN